MGAWTSKGRGLGTRSVADKLGKLFRSLPPAEQRSIVSEIAMRTGGVPPGFTGGMVVLGAVGLLMAGALASTIISH